MNNQITKNLSGFTDALGKLCQKHGVFPSGSLRLRSGEKLDEKTFKIEMVDVLDYGHAKDSFGPFLTLNIQEVEAQPVVSTKRSKVQIVDKDILLRNGVKSQADGNVYGNRREYNDHLKRHDMVEVGDQAPTEASKEIRGDFDCRKELHDAIKQHVG
jgi:hypothetical protein